MLKLLRLLAKALTMEAMLAKVLAKAPALVAMVDKAAKQALAQ